MTRTIPALAASFLGFVAMEGLIFHTNLYPYLLNPNSAAGYLETLIYNEQARSNVPNRILAIGDSRMALAPKSGNELTPETGYTFGSIADGGSTPRCWYYMLRDTDPDANRYPAIVITLDNYDDFETYEDSADRESDLHYVIARLRLSDLFEFANSHDTLQMKWLAFRGILLKGLVYKRDFQDFLLDPIARINLANLSRVASFHWTYDYVGTQEGNMSGVTVDWAAHKLTVPPDHAAQKAEFENYFLTPYPPDMGRHHAYMHYWLGKIYEHYRGSHTRLIFVREPRGPFVRPDLPRMNPHGTVRELAGNAEVTLMPEHFFDSLERPDLFKDQVHLNQTGIELFSHMLAREMRELLGPAK
jgi:hypothetical protein